MSELVECPTTIEIDITYDCNLNCKVCDRSCTQAPSQDSMSRDEIRNFINQSIEANHKWKRIKIMGGEPTLHPEFESIVSDILDLYVRSYSYNTIIEIVSNWYSPETKRLLYKFYNKTPIIQIPTYGVKAKNHIHACNFNDAPIDREGDCTYHVNRCQIPNVCGMNLNVHGYFVCGAGGGINRVLRANLGLSTLRDVTTQALQHQMDQLCKYCGHAIPIQLQRSVMSSTWKELYQKYNIENRSANLSKV